jgi:two-component system, LytTR family, response regulator LytT
MIRYLIIEDEEPAARRLQKLVSETAPESELLDSIVSVRSAVQWFAANAAPDLVFMDIHLADGLSFEIFKEADITCPIIFITAYDKYALEAFKVNSIDYLLKPVKKEDLGRALQKFKKLQASPAQPPVDFSKLINILQEGKAASYKKRFVIKYGDHIKTIETTDAAYFYTETRVNFLVTNDGKRYAIDYYLDQLEDMLDPRLFFRINRQFIISIHSIEEMLSYSKSRILLKLKPAAKLETIVSTERSAAFKAWLDGDT